MIGLQAHLAHKKHIIWDWNGTLLDDVDEVVEVTSQMLVDHGLQPVTHEQYRAVFCFPISQYYRRLGFDFERAPFETLSDQFVALYGAVASQCTLHKRAVPLFEVLLPPI
jgi:phosphoglycolate phosphatase